MRARFQLEACRPDQAGDVRNTPNGIRTRAAGVKGRSPRPLDDGGAAARGIGAGCMIDGPDRSAPRAFRPRPATMRRRGYPR